MPLAMCAVYVSLLRTPYMQETARDCRLEQIDAICSWADGFGQAGDVRAG